MSKKVDYKINNKEPCYTWLVLENGDYLEVDIFLLLENSIENSVEDEDKREKRKRKTKKEEEEKREKRKRKEKRERRKRFLFLLSFPPLSPFSPSSFLFFLSFPSFSPSSSPYFSSIWGFWPGLEIFNKS